MKDTVIKETGNSRFLRSALPAGTSWEDALAMLIAGTFPIDLAGINKEGIDTLGTALGKATLLSDGTEIALFGDAADRTVDNALSALIPWNLIDTIDNTVGYSGIWTAPDVFGDGSAYDLGVYMIGGGASGEGIAQSYSKQYAAEANGGPSGFGKNVVIGNVKPGDNFPWVVGAKGARASATASNGGIKAASNNGGTTSFNGETATGGTHSPRAGGQSPDTEGTTELPTGSRNLFGSCPPITAGNSYTQSPRESQNIFDPEMVTLSAGGRGYITTGGVAYSQTIGALPDGTKAGNGKAAFSNSVSGVDATGYGNGGGGCAAMATTNGGTVTVTCGAGSDGVIFLYARKAVS